MCCVDRLNSRTLLDVERPLILLILMMVFMMPHKVDGLPDLESRLSFDQLFHWINQLYSGRYRVLLPKMKLETTYNLPDSMKALGMIDASLFQEAIILSSS